MTKQKYIKTTKKIEACLRISKCISKESRHSTDGLFPFAMKLYNQHGENTMDILKKIINAADILNISIGYF